ncbi:c6 finger domain-containing protein [Venturia nashicola]|uniref:C6 finger domain-containing protein n=1 Tax=Venturia nashicola TaxID=86259 RepID=A0A4Z1PVG5_9PEZI|nr:c6 finger domain-containing protein [Venturia nashicola]
MDPSYIMQESEIELFSMEGDWEVDKETVYDQMQDIDLVSDLIVSPDLIQAISMRHSSPVPIPPVPFSLTGNISNEFQVHSLPQTFDHLLDPREHVNPSWTVPALQYSSYGSSADAESYFNGLDGDLPVYSAMSPSPQIGLSSFLHPSNFQQYSPSESTISRAESNASFDSIHDEEHKPAVERFHIPSNPQENHALALVHHQPSRRNKRSSPGPGVGKKSTRGRTGPLGVNNRRTTSEMRKLKACDNCRHRKTKCDTGFPCRACINYYKGDLVRHPCRGVHLDHVADKILLCGNIFPKDYGLFGTCLHKVGSTITIYLEVGFGKALAWPAELLATQHGNSYPTELRHSHVVYLLQTSTTTESNEKLERVRQDHWVFPAILTDTAKLSDALEKHIESLLDDPVSFQSFPLYKSPLQVLKAIYLYYKNSLPDPKQKQLLRQALKLLITVHICDHIKISPSEASQIIINDFFPYVHHSRITPCYIRSQLGVKFKDIASKLLKEVLTSLELHCLDKNCDHFPVVICTFAVLFMSVESIHYHAARDSYHADHSFQNIPGAIDDDPPDTQNNYPSTLVPATPEAFEKSTGVYELLSFYRACFSKYHLERFSASAESSSVPVVERLREAVENAKTYLERRGRDCIDAEGDVTFFFDRLLAKLFLLEELK